ncbi:MAG: energy-coupling factor transporter transmembrane component T [Methanobacteriaceae archaeon]|nr:energy-coupling factor transporter transmembrane component T [Methanobacteriaceae archaeon]
MNLIKIHPSVYIIYYVLWLVFVFLFNNPYYIIASYVAILALIALQGIRSEFKNIFKMVIPMAILIFIFNPLLYHEGAHRIYVMGSYFITVEACVYGLIMCATLLLVFILFASYNRAVSYQEMLYIFSKKFANLSMVMVMALRFVPLINFRFIEVKSIKSVSNDKYGDVNDVVRDKTKFDRFVDKIRSISSVFGVVTAWSLEDSMLTAKSMKSRAYGVAKRTNYLSFEFNLIDYFLIILMLIVLLVESIGLFYGYGRIEIYPVIKFSFNQIPLNIFFILWIVFLVPFVFLELYERFLWNRHNKQKLSKYNTNIVNEIATPNLSNLGDGSEKFVAQTEMCFNINGSNLRKLDFEGE